MPNITDVDVENIYILCIAAANFNIAIYPIEPSALSLTVDDSDECADENFGKNAPVN